MRRAGHRAARTRGHGGGAVNTSRQLGYALGVAVSGTVVTSRMRDTLPHEAAHTLAGGGAEALRGTFSSHTLHAAFASGLNTAAVVAGVTGTLAGALVLMLVRAPRRHQEPPLDSPVPTDGVPAPRG